MPTKAKDIPRNYRIPLILDLRQRDVLMKLKAENGNCSINSLIRAMLDKQMEAEGLLDDR